MPIVIYGESAGALGHEGGQGVEAVLLDDDDALAAAALDAVFAGIGATPPAAPAAPAADPALLHASLDRHPVPTAVVGEDPLRPLLYANAAFQRLLGIGAADADADAAAFARATALPTSRRPLLRLLRARLRGRRASETATLLDCDGGRRRVEIDYVPLGAGRRGLVSLRATGGGDLPPVRVLEIDPVCGIPRFGAGNDYLNAALEAAGASGGRVAVYHVDLDGFRAVNDNMDETVGNQALAQVAERLRTLLAERGRVWRLVSDEFVAVVPLRAAELEPMALGEALRARLEAPITILPYNVFLTATVGVALFPDHAQDAAGVLACAAAAMMQSKRTDVNAVRMYSDSERERRERHTLGYRISQALANGEMTLEYQPQVRAQDARIIAFEALLRWQSPQHGLLTASRFMHIADRQGLLVALGDWALDTACSQLSGWIRRGFDDVGVTVNIAGRQLLRPRFAEEVEAALTRHGVPAARLDLEIAENALATNFPRVRRTLAALKEIGVGLTLDDFGVDRSGLGYLAQIPVDKLKIDRSFVGGISTDAGEAVIARAIIAMGHELGLRVMAEGVETEAQLGYLRRNHCDELQGHLFAAAMPGAEAEALLHRRVLRPEAFAATRPDRTLLLLDDEENVLRSLVRLFRADGYRILTAANVRDAFQLLATHHVQVILSDQRMSDMSGTEFLGKVKELYPDTVRLILSGYTDLATVTDAINRGAIYRFLTKPWNDDELRAHIGEAFRTWSAQSQRTRERAR
ncbi:EAL domain-containing protein [Coralloluteibacterium stylophorae]